MTEVLVSRSSPRGTEIEMRSDSMMNLDCLSPCVLRRRMTDSKLTAVNRADSDGEDRVLQSPERPPYVISLVYVILQSTFWPLYGLVLMSLTKIDKKCLWTSFFPLTKTKLDDSRVVKQKLWLGLSQFPDSVRVLSFKNSSITFTFLPVSSNWENTGSGAFNGPKSMKRILDVVQGCIIY